jgi:four helix bundle protein
MKGEDPLVRYGAYVKAMALYDQVVNDTDRLKADFRGREIAGQLIRAAGSVCANFEEGYGRGTTTEFMHRLRIATGEAREVMGWYRRSMKFLPADIIARRLLEANEVIRMIVAMIGTMQRKMRDGR